MMTRQFARGLAVGLAATVTLGAGVVLAAEVESAIGNVVRVEDVRSDDNTVSGRVINETDDALENVRLLVSDQFLWRNERHPGENSPSDANTYVVPGPIPPHGSVTFEYRRPSPLPDRRDGEFKTDVSALEVTRRPMVAGGVYERRSYERDTYYGDTERKNDARHERLMDGE